MTQSVQLDIPDETFQGLQSYAKRQGISVPAYLSSVLQSQVEWNIPFQSFEPVTVPKKMLGNLFSMFKQAGDRPAH